MAKGGIGSEVGTSGLSVGVGGIITEELHANLSGRRALETWRNMKDNDPLVGAILFAVDMLCRQVEWRVDKKGAKQKDADFLEECMNDMSMSWGDFISETLSMLPFGFAYNELVYKKRLGPTPGKAEGKTLPTSRFKDGKIGWRKIPLRAQETLDHWEFDSEGGVAAFVQRAAPDYDDKPIPIEKGLLFRISVYKNNPEGRSMLRSAYVAWYYKRRIQQIEGTGIERDLAGFPVFWLPPEVLDETDESTAPVRAAWKKTAEQIRRDRQEYLLMPLEYDEGNKKYDFTLMSSGGSRTFDTGAVIARYNQEIAMTILADFILLGHEQVGSFALSSDKTNLFAVALGTILDSIADVLNRYAVPRLFELNNLDLTNLPEIQHGDVENPNMTELAAFITQLASAGVPFFPDEELENWLRKIAGLPEKSEEAKAAQEAKEQDGQQGWGGQGGGAEGPGGPSSGGDIYDPTNVDLSGL